MRRILAATLLTSAISSVALAFATTPAYAQADQMYGMDQADSGIGLDYFSEQLAPYGYWLYSDRWGLVWQPADVSYDFQPYYTSGHWIYTDEYGWYWQSSYQWGDIPFHYGRWVNDPDDGWLWIPGYTWSPGWVAWRTNGRYIGWMPMPPDDAFLGGRGDLGLGGVGVSFRFGLGQIGGLYGYSRWYGPGYDENRFARNWVFVGLGDIARPDYRGVVIRDPVKVVNIIHQTRNVTNYTIVNNYVVNKSVDVRVVERAAGRPILAVRAATIIRHPNLVATVAVGQRAQMRMRMIAPHGNGIANSAPPPPPRVVAKLSTRVPPPKAGRPTAHLFTKATVAAPDAQARFRGKPELGAGPGMMGPNGGPGEMKGPNSERPRGERPDGMNGPNSGPSSNTGKPSEMTGPNAGPSGQPGETNGSSAERPRHERPNGMTGPNGAPNSGQPGEMTGPNGGPSNAGQPGATEPTVGRPRHQRPPGSGAPNSGPASNTGQPGEMTGPSGAPSNAGQTGEPTGPTGERPHRQRPNSMTGPNGGSGTNTGQPGEMTGPNGGSPNAGPPGGSTGPTSERPHRERPGSMSGPNGGQPGEMTGPGNAPSSSDQPGGTSGPSGERPHRERPSGSTGPNAGSPPGGTSGPGATRPPVEPGNAPQNPPPHKPKKPQNPPQNPPQ